MFFSFNKIASNLYIYVTLRLNLITAGFFVVKHSSDFMFIQFCDKICASDHLKT